MKKLIIAGAVLLTASAFAQPLKYPQTHKEDVKDTYFGINVQDPYRWLEDDNSAATAAWVDEENKVTSSYLEKIPFRDKIRQRLTTMWNYAKQGAPFKRGKYYFDYRNNGIQNQSVLYVREGIDGTPRILIDPNTLSADATTSLSEISLRPDGKYMAYNLAKAGSDWVEIHVMDVASGKELSDVLHWVKFSTAAWKGDGFYYSHYPEPSKDAALSKKNTDNKVYFHKLGAAQNDDQLVFEDPAHPLRSFGVSVSDDERFEMLFGTESTSGNSFAFRNAAKGEKEWKVVDAAFEFDYNVLDNVGDSLLVLTNNKAVNNRLVMIADNKPAVADWKDIIPENKDLLESITLSNGKMVAKFLSDVKSRMMIYTMNGRKAGEIALPEAGIVKELNGSKSDANLFYTFTNYTTPSMVNRYDMITGKTDSYFKPTVDFNSSAYETKQVFYESKDKTKIPMYIVAKKGMVLDGTNPCFLYAYGGFNISVVPEFKATIATLLENGFVYAVPNIRGGGEYGEEWHKAGTILSKQNVFDDFIAAGQYLIEKKYTSSAKLAIHGRSNGGLLIGAVMTERPDLAKVALPGVGVLDMLRYHKFTIGYFWATDYGTSDKADEFKYLLKYSPLHNVKPVSYPATMVTTGDHDDRVVPAHSFKFAATLQENQKGDNPVLIRIDKQAGHGAGKPTAKQIDEWTDVYSFTFKNLNVTPKY